MDMLEQIMGSRSVGATVATLVQLRAVNLLSVLLLLVWALSSLGSQSILRVLETRLESRNTSIELVHFDNRRRFGWHVFDKRMKSRLISRASTRVEDLLLGASLLSSTAAKTGAMDLWGNIKIPFLPVADRTGGEWRVPNDDDADLERYSSLIGIPSGNISEGNTTFSIQSSYIELDCLNITRLQEGSEDSWDDVDIHWGWSDFLYGYDRDPNLIPVNGSWQGSNDNHTVDGFVEWNMAVNRFVHHSWFNFTEQEPRYEVLKLEYPQ